jgi:hypothetical protein
MEACFKENGDPHKDADDPHDTDGRAVGNARLVQAPLSILRANLLVRHPARNVAL